MIVTTINKGLGTGGSTVVGAVGGTVGATVATLSSSSAILTALGIGAAAGPIGIAVGALIAAGAAIASALKVGQGCGETCIAATQIVNEAEPILKANLDAYEHGQIDSATAQANFNNGWNAVIQACGKITGDAGTNCIGDRQSGACKWKATSKPYTSSPDVGACWNWFNGYYDPLSKPADFAPVQSTSVLGSSIGGLSGTTLLILGVGVVGIIMLGSGGKE